MGPLLRVWVSLPMTRKLADGARDIVAPAAVISPPGVRVWDSIMKFEAELAVNDWPPRVMIAGLLVPPAGSWTGIPLTITEDTEGTRE